MRGLAPNLWSSSKSSADEVTPFPRRNRHKMAMGKLFAIASCSNSTAWVISRMRNGSVASSALAERNASAVSESLTPRYRAAAAAMADESTNSWSISGGMGAAIFQRFVTGVWLLIFHEKFLLSVLVWLYCNR